MKKKIFTLFLALVASVGTMFAVTIDGLNYNLTNNTAEVARNDNVSGDITIPSSVTYYSVTYSVTSIGNYAFSGCTGLTSVTIPNSVTSIGDYAFYECSSLTSVTIPNSVTSIGEGAFLGCSSLTSITIPNSVTSIGEGAFLGCSSLTSITIPNSVTSIGNKAFRTCTSLTSVTIGNSVTSIGWSTFQECSSLTSVTIPNSVTSIGNKAFFECSSLTSITIPNSVTSIGNYAFSGCSSLTSPVYNAHCFAYMPTSYSGVYAIPEGIKQIAGGAFYECSSLTSVTIPNSVTSIGAYAFRTCTSLTSVTIGNSVTSIGAYAFYECDNLKTVIIGSSVKVLETAAFAYCSALETITCYSMRPPTVNEDALYGLDYSTIVYVPADYLNTYKMHDAWGLYDVRPLGATSAETEDVKITPSENEANVTWPAVSGAASYELVIKDKDGNIVCTLIFNANGQLTSIAFNAPSRNGAPAQTLNAGFSFTITGLDSGTGYDLTLTAKDNSGNIIEETTIPFHTNWAEGIEDVQSDEVQSTKVIKDGQVLILRNGKTYTMQGQEVK